MFLIAHGLNAKNRKYPDSLSMSTILCYYIIRGVPFVSIFYPDCCPSSISTDTHTGETYLFPATVTSNRVRLPCRLNGSQIFHSDYYAERRCEADIRDGARWTTPDYSLCRDMPEDTRILHSLNEVWYYLRHKSGERGLFIIEDMGLQGIDLNKNLKFTL